MTDSPLSAHPSSEIIVELSAAQLTLGSGPSSVHVLKGIDLDVKKGETVGVTGPSGSGKSTLLMVIAGLEKLDSGFVHVAGEAFHNLDEDELAAVRGRSIGIVFQSFHLIPNMTALENVAVPLELTGSENAFGKARKALEATGLAERLNHFPGQLSGGEQQRVAIARALAPNPVLIVADEPTGNLDGKTGRQIADLLFSKQLESGTTLILVTHDEKLAARCNRQVVMRSGRIDDAANGEASA